jgi:hypothetical protein
MEVAHFYHVYADGTWHTAVGEHLAALEDSRFDGEFHVGLIGSPDKVAEALDWFNVLRPPTAWWSADRGFEQVTISKLHEYTQTHDGAVMYAHTKGSGTISPFQEQWRAHMTFNVVNNWRACRHQLRQGYDAIGCHWLTAEEFPQVNVQTDFPMFGGNFWMATCEYLRKLPPVSTARRHEAESWIGLGNPNVMDLSPGWPGAWPYPNRPMRRLVVGR